MNANLWGDDELRPTNARHHEMRHLADQLGYDLNYSRSRGQWVVSIGLGDEVDTIRWLIGELAKKFPVDNADELQELQANLSEALLCLGVMVDQRETDSIKQEEQEWARAEREASADAARRNNINDANA